MIAAGWWIQRPSCVLTAAGQRWDLGNAVLPLAAQWCIAQGSHTVVKVSVVVLGGHTDLHNSVASQKCTDTGPNDANNRQ